MTPIRALATILCLVAFAAPIHAGPAAQEGRRQEMRGGRGDREPGPQARPQARPQPGPRPMEGRPMGRSEGRMAPSPQRPGRVEPQRRAWRDWDGQPGHRSRTLDEPRRGFEPSRGGYPAQLRPRQEVRGWQRDRGWARNGGWGPHGSWIEHRARDWGAEHRTWAQRGGYGGYWIPRDRFFTYYGPRHLFRFQPVIYGGYPRFWYGPYTFLIVDPWPWDWDEDWYDDGDCYIDFVDDGYYLFNRRHPGVALAITVSF